VERSELVKSQLLVVAWAAPKEPVALSGWAAGSLLPGAILLLDLWEIPLQDLWEILLLQDLWESLLHQDLWEILHQGLWESHRLGPWESLRLDLLGILLEALVIGSHQEIVEVWVIESLDCLAIGNL